jgi:hypothetical protein
MTTISVKSDIQNAIAHFGELSVALKGAAVVSALNRVGTMARTDSIREIGRTYALKRGDIAAQITISRATRRFEGLEVAITAKGRRSLPIAIFQARQTKAGVSFRIKRTGGRKQLGGSFVAKMRSGHVGVYRRKGKARLPIEEQFTIGLPKMFMARRTIAALDKIVRDRFPERLKHEIEFRLSRFSSAGGRLR